jgi:pimeloyl-ACP methyl ester carboxylesterase
MVDVGSGPPLVLIPGIQGRWEWMLPAVTALSRRHRVLTFSLGDVEAFDDWTRRVDAMLDRAGESSAVIAGVSFGGLIALRYAAQRPQRVRALVLVSTPAPACRLDRWTARFVRYPRLALPLFSARGFVRLVPEILVARPTWLQRLRLGAEYGYRVIRAPISPPRMARYVHAWQQIDLSGECDAVHAPTLVLTGDPHLDRVVQVHTSVDYVRRIADARHDVLPGTGHVGLISKPALFAETIDAFLDATAAAAAGAGAPPARRARHAS